MMSETAPTPVPALTPGLIAQLQTRTALDHTAQGRTYASLLFTHPAPQFEGVDQAAVGRLMHCVALTLGAVPAKSTAHRRFLIWSRAGVWGRLHEAILHRMDDAGLLDLSRAVLDSAHVRAKKGANSQVRAPWTGLGF